MAPPEMDERTAWWLDAFDLASRERPYTNGHPLPIPPLKVLDLRDRLLWPAGSEESIAVVTAMDVTFLEHVSKRKGKG